MPCCFKKDQLDTVNKEKKNYYLKCLGEQSLDTNNIDTTKYTLNDKLYILQETNKIQNGRFIYLSKYLDIFFNKIWKHDNKIKNHYLYESKSGYYFKYTIKHESNNFLATISNIFEKEIKDIIKILIDFLKNDTDDKFFTYLNNGDVCKFFKTKDKYIEYIKTSNNIEYDILYELLSLPNVLTKNGLYFFIFDKSNLIIKKNLEKDEIVERYYLNCLNIENNYTINENRDFIILIRDNIYYHPIYRVQKDEKIDKNIKLEKIFSNNKQIDELKIYNIKSCNNNLLNKIVGNNLLYCKNIINILNNKIKIKKQYIDNHFKAKYILLENGLYLPVFPSGISYNYKFDNINNISKILSYNEVIKELTKINKILNMNYIPKYIYYDKKDKNIIRIISIFLENELIIPIKIESIIETDIVKSGIPIKFQPLEETINLSIQQYNDNPINIIDQRHTRVKQHLYKNEAYNIFRLELSLYFELNKNIKEKIININFDSTLTVIEKKNELRKLIFNIIDNKLANKISNMKKIESVAEIVDNIPNLDNYNITNLRDYCNIHKTKEKCSTSLHCKWSKDTCKLLLTETLAIDFVNKVIEEIIQNNIQYKELLQEDEYYVSDIVDYTQYTYRNNQQIIKTSHYNLKKIMSELFGKDKILIGKKKIEDEVIEEYPELVELGKQLYQIIIPNKDSIIRAFINCYYWINNPIYDVESRNLGYFSEMQTLLTNRFKAKIIDYINYNEYFKKYFKKDTSFFDSFINKFRKQSNNTTCKLELLVLSKLTDYRIIVYNNYYNVIYLYLQGEVEATEENIKTFLKEEYKKNSIFIKLDFEDNNDIPKQISSIYYY